MTEPTPRPWVYTDAGYGPLGLYGPDDKGLWHASRDDEELRANARLIVTAVNCHEHLVTALHDAAAQLNYIEGRLETSRATAYEKENVPRALRAARAALAKVREQEQS